MTINFRKLIVLIIVIVSGGVIVRAILPAKTLLPNDPEYVNIEKAIQLYWEIRAEIAYTRDDSRLSEVIVNDWRGGTICEDAKQYCQKLIQWYKMKEGMGVSMYDGYLDFWRAMCAYQREVNRIYESSKEIMALMPYPTNEPDINMTPDAYSIEWYQLNELPEIKALKEVTGYIWDTSLPRRQPENIAIWSFHIESIVVGKLDSNVVYVTFTETEHGKPVMILIKNRGRWYVANYY